jgi:hypothetical protein
MSFLSNNLGRHKKGSSKKSKKVFGHKLLHFRTSKIGKFDNTRFIHQYIITCAGGVSIKNKVFLFFFFLFFFLFLSLFFSFPFPFFFSLPFPFPFLFLFLFLIPFLFLFLLTYTLYLYAQYYSNEDILTLTRLDTYIEPLSFRKVLQIWK